MNFFHGKKGHFATEKRALAKTWGGAAPQVPTPLIGGLLDQRYDIHRTTITFSIIRHEHILGLGALLSSIKREGDWLTIHENEAPRPRTYS